MPESETLRIKTLNQYRIAEADINHMFEDTVKLATECCDKPMAMVSFIDSQSQWITSQIGSLPTHIAREKTLCNHTLNQTDLFEVTDTLKNAHTKHSEFVLQAPHIRFYAGVPLISPDQQTLGTLCVLDTQPSELSKHQKAILMLLAKDVVSKLELRRKNHELSKLKDLYEQITENNQDLIFAKDKDFRILHANSAFLSLYPEHFRDNVIGYTTLEEYSQEEADAFLVQDKLAFEKGKTETIEEIMFPNGEKRILFTTKTRFEDNEGESYILGVARDVTEREELIQMLEKSNADLDEFAYIASHDLKAPLNAIKKLVDWIEEDTGDVLQGDNLEHFGMIKNRVDRMNMLLKDLLDYSRVGKNDGAPQSLNLRKTTQNCFELLDMPTTFVVDVDDIDLVLPKLPLELVLTNLMSNAIKHHDKPTGHIKITCNIRKHDYELRVSDDGPGIPPSLHKKIFMKFQTLKPRDEVEGSGLGLAMIEKALANYAGKITVQSDLGQGATFIVSWPKDSRDK